MSSPHECLDAALAETNRLRALLKRQKTAQVRSPDERSIAKATALTWFINHRSTVAEHLGADQLSTIDATFKTMLSLSDRAGARSKYDRMLKELRKELIALRSDTVAVTTTAKPPTTDSPPDLTSLVPDPRMRNILVNRWRECTLCLASGAPLAATVMMGGLLEALLLARVNKEPNKASVFTATKAPKDKKTSKTLLLQDWSLRHFIDVAHELKWISQSAKDVGEVLRDYRNYVHPYKEFSSGITLLQDDAAVLWEVCKSIARQVVKS